MHNCLKHDCISKDVLQSYILGHNFTVSVRPPGVGEEDSLSLGGRSSHSSVSEKSEVSTVTPRRMDVDLGYEPEGCASSFLPHERWRHSLFSMLHDREGFLALKYFLRTKEKECILECWLAMKGFKELGQTKNNANSSATSSSESSCSNSKIKQLSEQQITQRMKLAKLIYKTYLTSSSQKFVSIVKATTRQYILSQIKIVLNNNSLKLDHDLFVQAQSDIEHHIEATYYKDFLASREFAKLNAHYENNNSKLVELNGDGELRSSVTGSSIPYLPRLDENQVWNPTHCNNFCVISQKIPDNAYEMLPKLMHSHNQLANGVHRAVNETSDAFPYFTPGNIYVVPPASAIGSDQASKSSDATSETLSFTDNSSVDGVSYSSTRQGQKLLMRNHIKNNPTNALPECKEHIPRTSRMKQTDNHNLATRDPAAFFQKLETKLLVIFKEQAMSQQNFNGFSGNKLAVSVTNSVTVDEDMDEMLESHLKRVMLSPAGRYSPITKGKLRQPSINISHNIQSNFVLGPGVVPVMTQNEVPDVATPIIPVDKNRMISAWIQTPPSHINKAKKKSRSSLSINEEPTSHHYVHPAESTGLLSGENVRNLHLLAQDPNMPPLEQPDAMTTIEEVKRRLMEETDRSYEFPVLESLKLSSMTSTSDRCSQAALSSSAKINSFLKPDVYAAVDHCTDSDCSSETTTLSSVNHAVLLELNSNSTIIVYYIVPEDLPYRIKICHKPVTLGQFKNVLTRKDNFRYCFRQYSNELKKETFYELSNDGDILPLCDGRVIAKLYPIV